MNSDNGSIFNLMDQVTMILARDLTKKKEELISNKFKKVTGEDLTSDNCSRMTIQIPLYHSIFDKREVYCIDGNPVLEIYEPHPGTNMKIDEAWKISAEVKYREYE